MGWGKVKAGLQRRADKVKEWGWGGVGLGAVFCEAHVSRADRTLPREQDDQVVDCSPSL